MLVVNVLNYGYAVVLGRVFGPSEYGAYASFISLFLLVALLPLTLQQAGARYAAINESVAAYTTRLAWIAGGGFGLVLVAGSFWLSPLLNLPAGWLVWLGVLVPFYAWLGVLRGEAQGLQNFRGFGLNMVLEHAIKILLTPLALLVLPGATGAVAATLAALPATIWHLKRYQSTLQVTLARQQEVLQYSAPVFTNLGAQAVIINSDILMVNALLPRQEAGIYAAVAMIGRVVFYSSWAIGTALFPMVSARQNAGASPRLLLWVALGTVGLISGGITLVCAVAPEWVLGLLYGDAYLPGAPLVGPYALLTTLYALASAISNHYLALGEHAAGYLPLLGAAAQLVLIGLFHDTLSEVVWSQMAAKGGLLVLSLLSVVWFERRRQRSG
ncbi:hypothetical protein GCM10008955_36940 [Deinococcus malanensis]|uniref:Polysaccharide biosynthesis protein n=2 Tax=Deinococcus malanensis TaxID=1706855 RepID=A0ABQ2F4P9_9DEIO|nr:hypothetical protein GCM10008955_36940 [Deinococcus malanensis]